MGRRLALSTLRGETSRVTGRTLTVQTRVIHSGRHKGREVLVTGIAGSSSRNVIDRFAGCIDAVVTGGTSSRLHSGMGIGGWRPCSRVVTGTAGSRGLNMGGRLGQRIGADKRAVVTGLTIGCSNTEQGINRVP